MQDLEKRYSSSTLKLLQNPYVLQHIRAEFFPPTTLQVAPTDECNLNCAFCSVQKRDHNDIPLKPLTNCIRDLILKGLKSLEITGGGEPTLYGDINNLIQLCVDWNLAVGLITNGLELSNIHYDCFCHFYHRVFEWIRVSLNGLDVGKEPQLSALENVIDAEGSPTLSFSYVWNDLTTPEILSKIHELYLEYQPRFVRIVPNCLTKKTIHKTRRDALVGLDLFFDGNIPENWFLQTRSYRKPARCWFGYLKPFLNSDGCFYRCSAVPLVNRRFDSQWKMGEMQDVNKIWEANHFRPFDTSPCGLCFFKEQNDLIEEVLTEVEHSSFI